MRACIVVSHSVHTHEVFGKLTGVSQECGSGNMLSEARYQVVPARGKTGTSKLVSRLCSWVLAHSAVGV